MMVVIGPLLERGRCRLLVGVTAVYLPHGMMCELAIGTLVPRHVSGARGPSGNRDDPALAGVDDRLAASLGSAFCHTSLRRCVIT